MYDQTIPIVATQLLFTVGVTCALAFELPSEPLYKITQQLRDQLYGFNMSTTTEAPTTVPPEMMSDDYHDHDHSRIDYNSNGLNYVDKQHYYASMNKHNYYYYNDQYYQKPLSNYYFGDKSDNYAINTNNKSTSVTQKPLNQTNDVWTKVIKT